MKLKIMNPISLISLWRSLAKAGMGLRFSENESHLKHRSLSLFSLLGHHGHTNLGVRLHSIAADLNAAIDVDVHQGMKSIWLNLTKWHIPGDEDLHMVSLPKLTQTTVWNLKRTPWCLYCWQGALPNMNPEPPAVLEHSHRTALCSIVNKPFLCSQPWATSSLAKQDEDVRLPVYYQMEGWWSVQKGRKKKKKKEQSFYNRTKCFLLWCHAWSKLA